MCQYDIHVTSSNSLYIALELYHHLPVLINFKEMGYQNLEARLIKKTWLAPSLAKAAALVALMLPESI
ncbi:hypothetical protein UF75_2034 [Desulfosporosinus sp. I2]|nr:hypothetical protein UF75_2034 [Desulfosporosinus sp. I2]